MEAARHRQLFQRWRTGTAGGLTIVAPHAHLPVMPTGTHVNTVEAELTAMLLPHLPGARVRVDHSERWDRPCATFRWNGFLGLLPEERFHRLVQMIPEEFRAGKMAGFVWLELAPGEDVEAFLAQPRSEDVAEREGEIYAGLLDAGFFKKLAAALGPSPDKRCPGDYATTADVLAECGYDAPRTDEVKLILIRHGAYCDCQALVSVRGTLAEQYGRA